MHGDGNASKGNLLTLSVHYPKREIRMKTLILASLLLAINHVALSQESKPGEKPKIGRETIEWCDVWIYVISVK
jgi:hypothetical protein